MDISVIRVFASTYIFEQKDIVPEVKCKLIDFVKEAESDEILHLIFNGSIAENELNDANRFVLRSQAESHIYPLIVEASLLAEASITVDADGVVRALGKKVDQAKSGVGKAYKDIGTFATKHKRKSKIIGVTSLVAAGAAASHAVYKRYMTKAARSCSGKKGMDRRNCVVAFRKKALQAKVSALQSISGKCSQTKNPSSCKKKYDAKIKKIRYKISILHSKY